MKIDLKSLKNLRYSLVFKFILTVGITLLLSMATWAYFNIKSQKERILQDIVANADRLGDTIKLGARSTHVLDGEAEVRGYRRLADRLVLALAGQYTQTGSLRSDRQLPQVYWKRYGGEGSVRGVGRDEIVTVGGGRIGINLRAELRFQTGAFGLVSFLDRANVWRHGAELKPSDLIHPSGMVDGYGLGVRYVVGFPFRLDMAFSDGFDKQHDMRIYFSIGQAF